jgi:hypothetical protein
MTAVQRQTRLYVHLTQQITVFVHDGRLWGAHQMPTYALTRPSAPEVEFPS